MRHEGVKIRQLQVLKEILSMEMTHYQNQRCREEEDEGNPEFVAASPLEEQVCSVTKIETNQSCRHGPDGSSHQIDDSESSGRHSESAAGCGNYDPEADEAKRALGDTVMTLHTTARNFTGRTITGLEIRASVVDSDEKPVKQRTVVVVPGRQSELDPLKTMRVSIMIDGFSDSDNRANIKMEVTGFILR